MEDNRPLHPDKTLLLNFGLGKTNPHDAEWIATHLVSCQICADTIHNLSDDTFVSLVRSARNGAPGPEPTAADVTQPPAMQPHPDQEVPSTLVNLPRDLREHARYRIFELIGKGGMGDVYRAKHLVMNRKVALKVIKPQLVCSDEAVKRFQREVQVAAQLQHPNIVSVFDAEQAGKVHFLVMELLDGEDVAGLLRRHHRLSVEISCEIVRQAALAIQYAHELGLVHRDIKPSNLFVLRPVEGVSGSHGLQLKVLDLGLARLTTGMDSEEDADLTATGLIAGTVDFMAPEQARDTHSVDYRADIFALAATLYRMLTGRVPYQTGASKAVPQRLVALETAPLIPVRQLRPDCPVELAEIVEKALQRNPDDRPACAQDLAEVLARFADGQGFESIFSSSAAWTWEHGAAPAASNATTRMPQKNTVIVTSSQKRWKRRALAVAILLLTSVAAGIVYQVKFSGAQVQIEANDPDVATTLGANGITLADKTTGKTWKIQMGDDPAKVPAGTYRIDGQETLRISDESGVVIRASEFELKNGDARRFRISVVPPAKSSSVDLSGATPVLSGKSGGLLFGDDYSRLETPLKVHEDEPLTLEAFVLKQSFRSRYQNLFSNFDDFDNKYHGFHVAVDEAVDRWMISVWQDGENKKVLSTVPSQSGREMHVCAEVNDGEEIRLFLDGKLCASLPAPGPLCATHSPIWIGNAVPRSGRYSILGSIRQVRISLGLRYRKDFTPPTDLTVDADTLALYRLDEQASGEVVTDSSGHHQNARASYTNWLPVNGQSP